MGRRRRIEGSALATTSAPTTVPVTSIAHNPRNPRDDYNDIAELADSIREVGVLQPLGVVRYEVFLSHYPDHEQEVGTCDWVALNGNRRLAAARHLGLDEVPVHVLDRLGREDHLDESVLIENIHRQQLPPLREAQAIKMLLDRHGSQREVAKRIGKTQAFVSQRLALLSLTPDLKDALTTGELHVRDARRIAKLPQDEQHAAWEQLKRAADNPVIAPPTAGNGTPSDNPVITASAPANGTVGDNRVITHSPQPTPTTPTPAEATNGSGDNRVITQPPTPRRPTIAVDTPQQVADELRRHFDTPQLEELAKLLLN